MKLSEVIDEIVHDARGSLGTVRFALTAVQDNPANEAMREELLATADTEAVRLVAELSALPVLIDALTGPADREEVLAALTRVAESRGMTERSGDATHVRFDGADMRGALVRHLASSIGEWRDNELVLRP